MALPVGAFIAVLFAIEPPMLFAFMFWRRRGAAWGLLRGQAVRGIAGGILAGSAYGIAVWAMSLGELAHVVGLRETSVLTAAMIAAGVVLLQIGDVQ